MDHAGKCPTLLRDALFGSKKKAEARLGKALISQPALLAGVGAAVSAMPTGGANASREVARAISDLLDINVANVVLDGWRRHHNLREAARRTASDPDESEVVGLPKHVVELSEDPSVDVVVDEVLSVTVPVSVTISSVVDEAVAKVEGGHLTELHSGKVAVTAKLKIRGITIAEHQCVLDAADDIPLHDGVALLGQSDLTRSTCQVTTSPHPDASG